VFAAPISQARRREIDRGHFDFAFGHPRFIDHQEWSSTSYVGTVFGGDPAAFGVNFADGRTKGYPKTMLGEWWLPNAKELGSIVDYTRAPSVTGSPALDPVFNCTAITLPARPWTAGRRRPYQQPHHPSRA